MIYYTSDLHFLHQNIIKYCSRPFSDVQEMGIRLISNWNARVKPEDEVYLIGDVHMGNKAYIPHHVNQLNGKIILIKGNHDLHRSGNLWNQFKQSKISEYHDELYLEDSGIRLYLRHEPRMDWKPDERAQYHLTGHVHNAWRRVGNIINVGVDVWNYQPVTLTELLVAPEDQIKDDQKVQ
jgi:calcineurin-like phosphoesterase family protein